MADALERPSASGGSVRLSSGIRWYRSETVLKNYNQHILTLAICCLLSSLIGR